MAIPPAHSLEFDTAYTREPGGVGAPAVLLLTPQLSAQAIGQEAERLVSQYSVRQTAFTRWERLLALVDDTRSRELESMVSNDARTMFSLSVFLTSAAEHRRAVAVGSQGSLAERRAGKSERALTAWWSQVDEQRVLSGQEPFWYDLAFWMCLYGWYAVQYAAIKQDSLMIPVAIPLNPAECYPVFGDGLYRFARVFWATAGEALQMAKRLGGTLPGVKDANKSLKLVDWYWKSGEREVIRVVVASGLEGQGWRYVAEPHIVEGVSHIPILVGRVAGNPGGTESGSVFYENEQVYRDFNKWLSFFITLAKEKAKAPILAHNIPELEEKDVSPAEIRSGSVIIHTDNPEARAERIEPAAGTFEVQSLLGLVGGMLQRGGYPDLVYGGVGRELSGFAISQLLQAAERRIGMQVRRISLVDAIISEHWLDRFRDGEFESACLAGSEGGNPHKAFVEDFAPKDVPKKFKVVVEVPIRVGNDLMARMSIARQAIGTAEPLLDRTTVIDEILQMQDATLIDDRIARDAARKLVLPFKAAMELKQEAADLRAKYGEAADEVVGMLDVLAARILNEAGGLGSGQGAPPKTRIPPENMPPEMAGVSPDVIRAARSEGPANLNA